MTFFPNDQTFLAFKLFGLSFDIRWYAVLIMIGALLAYLVSRKEMRAARYISEDFFDSFFIYTLWVGIIGARLWYCIFYNFSFYFSDPIQIIRVWDGGLAIQGGIVAGNTHNDNRQSIQQNSSVNLTGNSFYVRSDQDIHDLAVEIATLTRTQQRGRGLRLA